ncbi:MAG: potassium channel family protein [Pirellulales bacterium]
MIFFRQWRYLFLLGALLILLVIQPIVSGFGAVGWLFDVLFVFVMLILVLAFAQDKVWRVIACILCIPAAMLSLGSHFLTSSAEAVSLTAGHVIGALFFILVTGRIIQSIFESKALSLDSIFGAICGYLLLGVAWGLTYGVIHAGNPESFQFHNSIRRQMEQGNYGSHVFIYYSFVTLTTVGYGDITPLSTPARTLAWVEAMTGQLYLAVLIAGLISALVAKKRN